MPEILVSLGDNIVHKYFFDKDVLSIGRSRDNDIVIENLSVSRNHSRLKRQNGKYVLIDLNSANGTYVNGVKVTKTELVHDDVITIGKHKLRFINEVLTDTQIITDALGADRTMVVDKAPVGLFRIVKGKQKNKAFKIIKYETFIGRASTNDIRLHDWFVSKRHGKIIRQGNKFFIKDLGSWRGIILNGVFQKEAELNNGDVLVLGSTHLEFEIRAPGEVPEAESPFQKEPTASLPEEEVGVENVLVHEPTAEINPYITPFEDAIDPVTEAEEPEAPKEGVSTLEEELEFSFEEVEAPVTEETSEEVVDLFEQQISVDDSIDIPLAELESEQAERVKIEVEERVEEIAEETPEEQLIPEMEDASPEAQSSPEEAAEETGSKPEAKASKTEIQIWEKAIKNKSKIIRREAARRLKKLTGKDYED